MNVQNIPNRLHDVFASTLEEPELQLTPNLKMGDIESWDSFNHINLMLGIEAEFGVEFDSDEIGTLLSVGQISDALLRRLDPDGS
jgi:acyl carrier protein